MLTENESGIRQPRIHRPRIHQLDPLVANQIAAGEVIDVGQYLGNFRLAVDEPLGGPVTGGLVVDSKPQTRVQAGVVPHAEELDLLRRRQAGQVRNEPAGRELAVLVGVLRGGL